MQVGPKITARQANSAQEAIDAALAAVDAARYAMGELHGDCDCAVCWDLETGQRSLVRANMEAQGLDDDVADDDAEVLEWARQLLAHRAG